MTPKLTHTKFAKGYWWRKCKKCDRWLKLEKMYHVHTRGEVRKWSELPQPPRQHTCKTCLKWYKAERRYGVSREVLQALPDECEICGSTRNLHIDHCHTKGIVRGKLCQLCNQAIGLLRENVDLLVKATDYLRKHQGDYPH